MRQLLIHLLAGTLYLLFMFAGVETYPRETTESPSILKASDWQLVPTYGPDGEATWLEDIPSGSGTFYTIINDNALYRFNTDTRRWTPLYSARDEENQPVYKTTDGSFSPVLVHAIQQDSTRLDRIWLLHSDEGLVYSDDSGKGWHRFAATELTDIRQVIPDPNDDKQLVALSGDGHLYHTTNQGGTWEVLPLNNVTFAVIDFTDQPMTVWTIRDRFLPIVRWQKPDYRVIEEKKRYLDIRHPSWMLNVPSPYSSKQREAKYFARIAALDTLGQSDPKSDTLLAVWRERQRAILAVAQSKTFDRAKIKTIAPRWTLTRYREGAERFETSPDTAAGIPIRTETECCNSGNIPVRLSMHPYQPWKISLAIKRPYPSRNPRLETYISTNSGRSWQRFNRLGRWDTNVRTVGGSDRLGTTYSEDQGGLARFYDRGTNYIEPLRFKTNRFFIGFQGNYYPMHGLTAHVFRPEEVDWNRALIGTSHGILGWDLTDFLIVDASAGLAEPLPFTRMIQSADDPNLLYAGSQHGFYRSRDGGQQWERLNGMPVIDLVSRPKEEQSLYFSCNGILYSSDDEGKTWYIATKTSAYEYIRGATTLFTGEDGTLFWQENHRIVSNKPGSDTWIVFPYNLEDDQLLVYASSRIAYLYSKKKNELVVKDRLDYHRTTMNIPEGDLFIFPGQPYKSQLLTVLTDSELMISRDYGQHWSPALSLDNHLSQASKRSMLIRGNELLIAAEGLLYAWKKGDPHMTQLGAIPKGVALRTALRDGRLLVTNQDETMSWLLDIDGETE